NVHVSAQNRSAEESLAGLRDFNMIVQYAKADVLPEETQPILLQKLQDRAIEALKQANIPLLKSTDHAEMAGRPRLVFTVTLNKEGHHDPAIHVESRVYQTVLLRRDRTKEMELATWVQSGIGVPSVTEKMLFDVLDGQLKAFIDAYRTANPESTTDNRGLDALWPARDNANSLQGLNGIRLFIWCGPNRSVSPETDVLLKMLKSEAEKKLQAAGIPVLLHATKEEPEGGPLLYVAIRLNRPGSRPDSIGVESKFWQRVFPARNPEKMLHVVTWESRVSEGTPITDDAVLKIVSSQLDEFIKAYRQANPTRQVTAN
ncbi:MAG TPA: hypothetical protein VFM05_10765, partial [Candidatus Saccharimonadales bacterium]|nr:hypothetical protein [Candidatus Saccharimonadales bacterium]